MKEKIKVSIVIATHNRKEELRKLLISLQAQTYSKKHFEIIVIDDGSADGTQLLIREVLPIFEGRLRYFYVPKQPNSGVTRNIGTKKANGEIFVFIDSDCIVTPDWLKNIVNEFGRDEKIGCVGGQETYHNEFPFFAKCCSFARNFLLQISGASIGGKRKFRFARYRPSSSNLAISSKVFKEVNGFNENFKHGYDLELYHRIRSLGYKFAYAPDALVYHKRRDTILKNIRQHFEFGQWRVLGFKLHKLSVEPIYFLPSAILLFGSILTIGSFFSETLFFVTKWFYTGIISFLLLIGIMGVVNLKDPRVFFIVPLVFVFHQVAYAIGFIYGFLKRWTKK